MSQQVDRLRTLRARARADRDAVDVDLDALEAWLDADRGQVRKTALDVATVVARDDPDRLRPLVDAVTDRLDDAAPFVAIAAAETVCELAARRPAAVVPAVPAVLEHLEADPPLFRYRLARTIGSVATARPAALVEHVDELVDVLSSAPTVATSADALLEGDEPSTLERRAAQQTRRGRGRELGRDRARSSAVREIVANVLVEVAREAPGACAPRVPALASILEDSSEASVRGAVVDVCSHVAADDPGQVEAAVDPLLEALSADEPFVQARAVRALGFAEATAAVDPLRDLADEAADDDLAAFAAETAAWLESRA